MEASSPAEIRKLDAGSKKTWKLHQSIDELHKWATYLQQSAERFNEEFTAYNSRLIFVTAPEQRLYREIQENLQALKKESSQLKSRAKRLHGPRR